MRIYRTDTLQAVDLGSGIHEAKHVAPAPGAEHEIERVAVFCTANPTATTAIITDGPFVLGGIITSAMDFTADGSGDSRSYRPPLRVKSGSAMEVIWTGVPANKLCFARIQYVIVTEGDFTW